MAGTARAAPPAALLETTLEGAVCFAAVGAAGAASAGAVRLARGLLYATLAGKLKAALVGLLALALLGSGASALLPPLAAARASAAEPPAGKAEASPAIGDAFGDPLPPWALARLGTLRWRHGPGLSHIAFDAAGDRVVTAGVEGVVRVWDADTGREVQCRWGDPLRPDHAGRRALSADGRRAAVVERDGTLRVLDVRSGKEVGRIATGPPAGETEAALNRDGSAVALRTDRQLTVWDVAKGGVLCRTPTEAVVDLVFLDVGGRATSMSMAGTHSLAFAPDGRSLALCFRYRDCGVQVFDVATGKERWRVAEATDQRRDTVHRASAPAFSGDGKLLARIGPDGSVRLHETERGREVRRLAAKSTEDPAVRCALSADGKRLATLTKREVVRIYDVAGGKERVVLGEAAEDDRTGLRGMTAPLAVVFSPDGKTLAQAQGANAVRLWDVETGRVRPGGAGHVGSVQSVTASTDGKTLTTRGSDDTVRHWDLASGKERSRFAVPAEALGSALSPDGRTLAVLGEGAIVLRDLASGKQVQRFALPAVPAPWWLGVVALPSGAFAPDGKRLAARGFDHKLRVWDVATGKEVAVLGGGPKGPGQEASTCVTAFAWTADGAEVATLTLTVADASEAAGVADLGAVFLPTEPATTAKSTLRLWDVGSGRLLREWNPPRPPLALAFSPDGRTVVVATTQALHLWEKASNRERWQCKATAVALAFSPDGRLLATAEGNGVRLRDVRDGRELAHFTGHQAPVRALAFTPDGKAVISASADSTALVWDLTRPRAAAAPEKDPFAVEKSWEDLLGEDAARANRAVAALAASPQQSVPWLREHLRPAVAPEAKRIETSLADLDADTFETRERAARELTKLGGVVRPALEKALEGKPAPEQRRRIEALLESLAPGGSLPSAEDLRQIRAVEALEKAATPEARRLLEELAGGAPGALRTMEARAALKRLGK